MANDARHAAWHPVYEVRELLEGNPALDLGLLYRCNDYLDAAEFAFEFLEINDPRRDGRVNTIEIVKVHGGKRETVLTYRHSPSAPMSSGDLIAHWGFDVTKPWRGPGEVEVAR